VGAFALWIARRGQRYVDDHDTPLTRGVNMTLLVIAAVLGLLFLIARSSR